MPLRVSRYSAFSLVELLMVVALMGVLAGFVVSNASPSLHARLESAGEIVSGDLAYARSLAVAGNSEYRVRFDTENNRYLLDHTGDNTELENLPSSVFWSPCELAQTQSISLAQLPLGGVVVRLHAATSNSNRVGSVEFSPLGGTTRSASTTLWLSIGTGNEKRYLPIVLNPVTGLAVVGAISAVAPVVNIPPTGASP